MRMRNRRGGARLGLLSLLVGSVMLTLFVGSSAAAPTCTTTAGVTTCTFAYTGAADTWTVPAGVTSATFDLYGAAGGSFAYLAAPGGVGGKGGHVHATVAVTPGATLYVRVGGEGGDGLVRIHPNSSTVPGGFNGGGTNAGSCNILNCVLVLGGSGGGASDIRGSGDGLGDRLLVAGGAGGASFGGGFIHGQGTPGDGGDSGTAAPSAILGTTVCPGGGAGTLVGPGAAAGGGCIGGSAGAAAGGAGGDGVGVGAGGGGYYGGGAGGGALATAESDLVGSGGGGGSNFVVAGATNTSMENGVREGNGLVTITYTEPPVPYAFTGFFKPISNPPFINVVKAGSGVAIKFSLSGNQGLNIFAAGYPASVQLDPTCLSVGAVPEATSPAGSSGLSYNPTTDTYSYNWKTHKSWKGACRQLVVGLNDGTFHEAFFKFK